MQQVLVDQEISKTPNFDAWHGVFLIIVLLVGQFFGSILGRFVYLLGSEGWAAWSLLNQGVTGTATLVASILGGTLVSILLFVWLSAVLAGSLLRNATSCGIAWVPATRRQMGISVFMGFILSSIVVITTVIFPVPDSASDGPIATLVHGGVWSYMFVLGLGFVYAPIAEEFIFRGVLFTTFRRRWGILACSNSSDIIIYACTSA